MVGFRCPWAGVLSLLAPSAAQAIDYYVSAGGSDLNSGTTLGQAWRTPSRVNRAVLMPGDRVLFQGGQNFYGGLYFDALDRGTAARPIVISSYGTGRAMIRSGISFGFYAYNTAGYEVRNINFYGNGHTVNTSSGVTFYNDLPHLTRLDYLRLTGVAVMGYGQYGVAIGASHKSGYRDVRLSNVNSHDNALAGINIFGEFSPGSEYSHEQVLIDHCLAWRNPGRAGLTTNTGNGIVISDVDHGTIQYSMAAWNGALNTANGGPIGIWAWDSRDVVIQYNESHHNRTNSASDGGGFDLDGGMTRSVMQYNYSHHNDGAGFLLAQFPRARPFSDNTVRYNISQNDGRKNGYGAIHFWNGGGGLQRCEIHNNTVYVSPAPTGTPRAVYFQNPVRDVHVRNNILITTGGLRLVEAVGEQPGVLFQGNDYWTSGAGFWIRWSGINHWSLTGWRAATGQEMLGGGPVGYRVEPLLVNAGGGENLNDATRLQSLSAYRLQPGSRLIDSGLNLPVLFGVDDGGRDFYGTAVPQGVRADIGAHEWVAP